MTGPSTVPAGTPSSTHLTPILLGHSLESDLKALKISHPFCIDTAITYHHPRGRPLKPGLAWLTRKWCGREIQNRGEGGHDPEEDARACISLLKKKLELGPGFGEFKIDYESIFERMSRSTKGAAGGGVRSAVVDYGNPQMMHGSKATTTVACTSDADVFKGLLDVIPSHQFVFGRFMSLADTLGCEYADCFIFGRRSLLQKGRLRNHRLMVRCLNRLLRLRAIKSSRSSQR